MPEATANQSLASEMIGASLGRIATAAANAHEHFINTGKAMDYSFLQGKDMVSLPESLGAREVGSQTTPAGPKAAG